MEPFLSYTCSMTHHNFWPRPTARQNTPMIVKLVKVLLLSNTWLSASQPWSLILPPATRHAT